MSGWVGPPFQTARFQCLKCWWVRVMRRFTSMASSASAAVRRNRVCRGPCTRTLGTRGKQGVSRLSDFLDVIAAKANSAYWQHGDGQDVHSHRSGDRRLPAGHHGEVIHHVRGDDVAAPRTRTVWTRTWLRWCVSANLWAVSARRVSQVGCSFHAKRALSVSPSAAARNCPPAVPISNKYERFPPGDSSRSRRP